MVRYPTPIKRLLQKKRSWWQYYQEHHEQIRPIVTETITKILACGTALMGFKELKCSDSACTHRKRIFFSCHSRYCSTCGKKSTDQWIAQQREILPKTSWQHITFTMPDSLWEVFKTNEHLLGQLSALSVKGLLKWASRKGVKVGIFTALHTFGRDLKYNTHMHVSVTCGGIDLQQLSWKKLYFPKKAIMPQWRYGVINLLRQADKEGNLTRPDGAYSDRQWQEFLNAQYEKNWVVDLAKPTHSPEKTINYLGRYLRRPPIAMSRLRHYDGQQVVFDYLNHHTGRHESKHCSVEEFIDRWTQHIPEKGFRMIRYYGFLANRVRSKWLPKVYDLLNQTVKKVKKIRYAGLLKSNFGTDPMKCILCGSPMRFVSLTRGKTLDQLRAYHEPLACAKPVK